MVRIQLKNHMGFYFKLAKMPFLEANAVRTHLGQNCWGPCGVIQLVTGLCTALFTRRSRERL